jgi:hypothetical protein
MLQQRFTLKVPLLLFSLSFASEAFSQIFPNYQSPYRYYDSREHLNPKTDWSHLTPSDKEMLRDFLSGRKPASDFIASLKAANIDLKLSISPSDSEHANLVSPNIVDKPLSLIHAVALSGNEKVADALGASPSIELQFVKSRSFWANRPTMAKTTSSIGLDELDKLAQHMLVARGLRDAHYEAFSRLSDGILKAHNLTELPVDYSISNLNFFISLKEVPTEVAKTYSASLEDGIFYRNKLHYSEALRRHGMVQLNADYKFPDNSRYLPGRRLVTILETRDTSRPPTFSQLPQAVANQSNYFLSLDPHSQNTFMFEYQPTVAEAMFEPSQDKFLIQDDVHNRLLFHGGSNYAKKIMLAVAHNYNNIRPENWLLPSYLQKYYPRTTSGGLMDLHIVSRQNSSNSIETSTLALDARSVLRELDGTFYGDGGTSQSLFVTELARVKSPLTSTSHMSDVHTYFHFNGAYGALSFDATFDKSFLRNVKNRTNILKPMFSEAPSSLMARWIEKLIAYHDAKISDRLLAVSDLNEEYKAKPAEVRKDLHSVIRSLALNGKTIFEIRTAFGRFLAGSEASNELKAVLSEELAKIENDLEVRITGRNPVQSEDKPVGVQEDLWMYMPRLWGEAPKDAAMRRQLRDLKGRSMRDLHYLNPPMRGAAAELAVLKRDKVEPAAKEALRFQEILFDLPIENHNGSLKNFLIFHLSGCAEAKSFKAWGRERPMESIFKQNEIVKRFGLWAEGSLTQRLEILLHIMGIEIDAAKSAELSATVKKLEQHQREDLVKRTYPFASGAAFLYMSENFGVDISNKDYCAKLSLAAQHEVENRFLRMNQAGIKLPVMARYLGLQEDSLTGLAEASRYVDEKLPFEVRKTLIPIASKCVECHNPQDDSNKFRFHFSAEDFARATESKSSTSGSANLAEEMIKRADEAFGSKKRMPRGESVLTAEEIKAFKEVLSGYGAKKP